MQLPLRLIKATNLYFLSILAISQALSLHNLLGHLLPISLLKSISTIDSLSSKALHSDITPSFPKPILPRARDMRLLLSDRP